MESSDLFTRTVERMKLGDDICDVLYHFEVDDQFLIARIFLALKALLRRDDLLAGQIYSVSKLLLGIQRMPLRTPGLNVRIELTDELEEDSTTYSISIKEDEFRVDSSGNITGSLGTDSFSGPAFEIGQHYRECDVEFVFHFCWPEIFTEMAELSEISIEDDTDDALLDWEHPDGSMFWEWIENYPQD